MEKIFGSLMLSRNAQNLYWLGRYLQRAEHVCGMLKLQVTTLADRPRHEVHLGWNRIYNSLGRQPPLAKAIIEPYDDDDLMFADAYILADDLTFETSNPNSIRNCLAYGRENARQSRNCITFAMWAALNRFWLQLKDQNLVKVWMPIPESFYDDILGKLESFIGTTSTTMYRNQGWNFLQLGRALEQAQQTSALLLAQQQMDNYPHGWLGLLRIYHTTSVYQHLYPGSIQPSKVAQLLMRDPAAPHSLVNTLLRLKEEIKVLTTINADANGAKLDNKLHQLQTIISDKALDLAAYHQHLCQLDQLIAARWFFYCVEDDTIESS